MQVEEKKPEKPEIANKTNNNLIPAPPKDFVSVNNTKNEKDKKGVFSFFKILIISFAVIIILLFMFLTFYNIFRTTILSGVHIKSFDVSNLSKSDARYELDNYIKNHMPEEITLVYDDFEASISVSQIEANFDTKTASTSAYNLGKQGNIFEDNLCVLTTMFGNVNIEPKLNINKQQLTKNLEDISTQLPDAVVESSYYIDGTNLIVTSGKEGSVVDIDATIDAIKSSISDFSTKNKIVKIRVKNKEPDPIDIEKIYEETRKEPVDAYYTKEPFAVYPSENGIDFDIPIEEAKNIISSEPKDEYSIPLKILYPNVTTNMIGTEAFPDLLSAFSTNYAASNSNRTTNLILASNKINGTVIMPGETFSYNKVVGERTIAAGYKEAPIYVQGKVVNGLGGGICQIASTLYNAVVFANLEVTQRSNHQFVPSYAPASRDATVVYGAIDFQFKNNRQYPIKLVSSVYNGVATFQIFGQKQEDDYEVQISNYETGRTATAIYSEAYKILKKDDTVVDKVLLSRDVYKRH